MRFLSIGSTGYKKEAFVDESDFEGTLVLEKLAAVGKIDSFFEAVDSDDFSKAQFLMNLAGVDLETIAIVIQKIKEASGEH